MKEERIIVKECIVKGERIITKECIMKGERIITKEGNARIRGYFQGR